MADSKKGLLSCVRNCKRKLVMGVLIAATPALTACYGEFPLTRSVYEMNGEVENPVVEQVVFWAFCILPVYGGAAFIDAVVFNLVDFWFNGEIDVDVSQYETPEGDTVTLARGDTDKELIMTVSRNGEVLDQMSFVHTGETVQTLDSDGNHVGYVLVGEDNSLQLTDEDGRVIRTLSPAQALVPQS